MTINRIRGGLALALCLAAPAFAQTAADVYPSRPVKIVVPYSAASTADNVARSIGEKLSQRFKQPFVVDNKAGAGGTIGISAVAKSPADGYTLVLTTSSPLVISPLIDKSVNYNVEKDLAPVGLLGIGGLLLVANPSLPAKDLNELIALLKKSPGKYS
ncbi:MAG: tripartite tricarboxylate transporter substrate binding protein, partial [Comamonadaceae bacterium]